MSQVHSQKYSTNLGKYIVGSTEEIIEKNLLRYYRNKINLILTSPPFPLNKKKQYGNFQGDKYKKW